MSKLKQPIVLPCLWYEEDFFRVFLSNVVRFEYFQDPVIFKKAIRCTLIALGYSEHYINGEFRDKMDEFFNENFPIDPEVQ